MEPTDHELLAKYRREKCEQAFRQLVTRHAAMVFATARRITGDPHRSEEISQAVFLLLAGKAGEIGSHQPIAGWLYHTTRHRSLDFLRSEARRLNREQLSAEMHSQDNEPQPSPLAGELESALDALQPDERDLLVIRYLEDRPLLEVGHELGISEQAAQKRVSRALEKLRGIFGQRGVTLTSGALATLLVGEATAVVPAGLISSTTAAVVGTAAATTITHGVSTTMNLLNLKTAAAILSVAALTGTSTYLVKEHETDKLRADNHSLIETQAAAAKAQQEAASAIQFRDEQIEQLKKNVADLPRLRGEVTALGNDKIDLQNRLVTLAAAKAASGIDLPKAPAKAVGQIDTAHLVFAGFKTPVSALQSILWAGKNHETNTLLKAFSLNGLPAKVREAMGGQMTTENANNFRFQFGGDAVVNIDSFEELSSDLVVLRISSPGEPTAPIAFEKIGDDWKVRPTITEYSENPPR